jgi:hypothetical protein
VLVDRQILLLDCRKMRLRSSDNKGNKGTYKLQSPGAGHTLSDSTLNSVSTSHSPGSWGKEKRDGEEVGREELRLALFVFAFPRGNPRDSN